MTSKVGTLDYCAPEILKGTPYSEKCDLWSVGILACILCSGQRPFDTSRNGGDEDRTVSEILACDVEWQYYPFRGPDFLEKIIPSMVQLEPDKRPDAKSLAADPILVKYRREKRCCMTFCNTFMP